MNMLIIRKIIYSDFNENLSNWIDLFLIILLLTVIFTHLDDVLNHTEEKTRNHLRVFAITVVFISVNLPRTFRYIFEVRI